MNISYSPKEISSLSNVVDTYIRWREFSKKDDRSYEYYHPSEFGGCLREQQYKHYAWKGLIKILPERADSKKHRMYDKGHNMHKRWSDYFNDIGNVLMGRWKCKNKLCLLFDDNGEIIKTDKKFINEIYNNKNSEKSSRIYSDKDPIFRPEKCVCGCSDFGYLESIAFDEKLKMKGNADIILNFDALEEIRFKGISINYNKEFLPINDKKIVMDMKTINSNQWKTQLLLKGPHKKYFVQLIIYIYILNCEYGVLAYENKDTSEMMWYKVEKNDDWWNIIKKQTEQLIDMANSSKPKLPPPKYEKSSMGILSCQYCNFKSFCHKSSVWDLKDLEKRRYDFYKDLL